MEQQLIFCNECERPWGYVLELGQLPDGTTQRIAQQAMDEALAEILEGSYHPGFVADLTGAPDVDLEEIVFITEATSQFASEYLNCEVLCEGSCWMTLRDLDLPAWLLKGRKRRWSYRWDCCALDLTTNFAAMNHAEVNV
jgi:hypothetical protein